VRGDSPGEVTFRVKEGGTKRGPSERGRKTGCCVRMYREIGRGRSREGKESWGKTEKTRKKVHKKPNRRRNKKKRSTGERLFKKTGKRGV